MIQKSKYSDDGLFILELKAVESTNPFGHISGDKIFLNKIGILIKEKFNTIPHNYPHIVLHETIVMPNFVMACIEIRLANINRDRRYQNESNLSKLNKAVPLPDVIREFKLQTSNLLKLYGFSDFSWKKTKYSRIKTGFNVYDIKKFIHKTAIDWKKAAIQSQ